MEEVRTEQNKIHDQISEIESENKQQMKSENKQQMESENKQ